MIRSMDIQSKLARYRELVASLEPPKKPRPGRLHASTSPVKRSLSKAPLKTAALDLRVSGTGLFTQCSFESLPVMEPILNGPLNVSGPCEAPSTSPATCLSESFSVLTSTPPFTPSVLSVLSTLELNIKAVRDRTKLL